MGRADDLRTVTGLPVTMQLIPGKAKVFHIDALGWSPDALQTRRGMLASGEKGLGQRMVMATARGKAKAGDHAGRGHRGEQMQALIPANAIAPADIGLAGQPSAATSLRISCRNARTVQCLIKQRCACIWSSRNKLKATITSRYCRGTRLNCSRLGKRGNAVRKRLNA